MGFNIAGLIFNEKVNQKELEDLFDNKLEYLKDVSFEEATTSFRDENTIDVLQTEHGTFVIMMLGEIYDLTIIQSEVIQFMVSEVSDTYYFEKYSAGKLDRKYIASLGEVIEDVGDGSVGGDEDLIDTIWEFADSYLQNDFLQNMFEMNFMRYEIK